MTSQRVSVPAAALLAACLCLLLLAAGPSLAAEPPKDGARQPRPVAVVVAAAKRQDVPLTLSAVGSAQASATVKVRSRIGGELVAVHFKEGQEVRQGDPLFNIDPRPLEADVREAQAKLERDRALLVKSEEDNRRYAELLRQKIISLEQFQQVETNLASLKASVRADEAALESARVQLSYASIRAPIAGRAGKLLVDRGNMVKANDDPLVVLMQLEPIEVAFSVPEEHLPAVAAGMRRGPMAVEAAAPKAEGPPARGALTFVDNAVDRSTGTIALKARFDNRDRALWPGQFVNVSLRIGEIKDAVTVPAEAVQAGQEGQYVYVVGQNGTAELRPVTIGPAVSLGAAGASQDVVIRSGVAPGERVVVDGQLRLTPGAAVEPRDPKAKAGDKPEGKPDGKADAPDASKAKGPAS